MITKNENFKNYFNLFLSIIFVFVLIGIFYTIAMRNVAKDSITNSATNNINSNIANDNIENKKYATANGKKIYIEVADTDASRQQGLSDRDGLCAECGMLFVFPQNGYYGFWMKDMNFNIDIVFLWWYFLCINLTCYLTFH